MKLTKPTFLLGCLVGGMGAAALPMLMSLSRAETKLLPFQGRLTEANGATIADGAKVVEFKMYDAPTGGNVKWAGEVQKLSVNGGLVNTLLGSKASLGSVDFSTPCYLQITVDADNNGQISAADPPLLPRQSVVPALYAAVTGQMQYIIPPSGGNPATVASKGWEAVFDNGSPDTGRIGGDKLSDASVGTSKMTNLSVTSAILGNNSVTNNKIEDGTIGFSKLTPRGLDPAGFVSSNGGIAQGQYSGEWSSILTANTWASAPITANLTITGRPVRILLLPINNGGTDPSLISFESDTGIEAGGAVRVIRDSTTALGSSTMRYVDTQSSSNRLIACPPGAFSWIDTPAVGTHSYQLQVESLTGGMVRVRYVRIIAFEM